MQRQEEGNIIISCDFCGRDWDEIIPMIEGHKGSVICLDCIKTALEEAAGNENFSCTMCLQNKSADVKSWRKTDAVDSPGLNKNAVICWDDILQAAKAFGKDKDTDFNWDRSKY